MFIVFLIGSGGIALAGVVAMLGSIGTYLRVSDRFNQNMLAVSDYIMLVSVLVWFIGAVGMLLKG